MKSKIFIPFLLWGSTIVLNEQVYAQFDTPQQRWNQFVEQMDFRQIGPATTSGRISDIAVNPSNHSEYYIAAAYGGVWKTQNGGITFNPIFDQYGVQSIGCLAIDPSNPKIIWVGTGENNNQRSVGYGNGLYKSEDGGKSFVNVGLKNSFHIGKIAINPKNSQEIWVAAYGPLWSDKGEKGIFFTKDGGKNWILSLTDDKTGFNEVHIDPFNENILYACAHQRRRHEWTYLGGGPNSAIYRSTDKGHTWKKLNNGIPQEDKGRITLVVSPQKSGKLTAVIETQGKSGGVFVSDDFGSSWQKINDYFSSGNYYQEVFSDPQNDQRLFFMDTYLHFSEDGGKTIKRFSEKNKHVDNHAIWIDPKNDKHLLVGCDGGLYETYDFGENWLFNENLPVTQFYRVSSDNTKPFYNVYGGTQDNFSIGGPSRNNTSNGIPNEDWFVTVGGDGFKSQIDPEDPNIVYSQWQYGGLIRFDKRTGDQIDIKPQIESNQTPLVWNWDAPLVISKFDSKKLYFGANRLFCSPDRGSSWKIISPVVGRNLDRNKLPVMDKIWGLDAVAKNQSTSIYGNITALAEGNKYGELIIGTDDGIVYFTQNNGESWDSINLSSNMNLLKIGKEKDAVQIYPFVTAVQISSSGEFYVAFDNHRQGDFKPYIFRSSNKGKTWNACNMGIPDNHPVKTIWVDPIDSDILCVGTEFGLFVSSNKGDKFNKFGSNLPPVPIKDIYYQTESQDLILATFGRGIAICDDYHLIRELKKSSNKIIAEKQHQYFIPYDKLGDRGNSFRGANRFQGSNLDEKFRIYVYIDSVSKSVKESRKETEKKSEYYPTIEEIKKEAEALTIQYLMEVKSDNNLNVSVFKLNLKKGWNLVQWDLKLGIEPFDLKSPGAEITFGPYISPGKYQFQLVEYAPEIGTIKPFGDNLSCEAQLNYLYPINELIQFNPERYKNWESIKLSRKKFMKIQNLFEDLLKQHEKALEIAPWNPSMKDSAVISRINHSRKSLLEIKYELIGGHPIEKYEFPTHSSIEDQFFNIYQNMKGSLQAPTKTHFNMIQTINKRIEELEIKLSQLKQEFDKDVINLK